jgi:hypothetical protein
VTIDVDRIGTSGRQLKRNTNQFEYDMNEGQDKNILTDANRLNWLENPNVSFPVL